ncbi:AraC family transcriptional regulator [Streptomyces xanthii]|uniref:AraC family transcriptional regulator n=1 Tax=Streptomyces xanthii TaxID=2768069 RepID=A0A7H1B7Y3_9ACTN|nr:helix-turn-helix domain-containing protein [Streptomyces xanthii]QNS04838.1 AraC family transcriptional regulator [Streptomyces xanthii]
MVKNGHETIQEVAYTPPPAAAAGIEVMAIEELRERMLRGGTEAVRDAEGAGHPQRPEFHLLLTVRRGRLTHMVDFTDHSLTDGTWLWVRPGQVQRFGDLGTASGTLVLFRPDVLDPATAADVHLDDPFGRTLWEASGEDAGALHQALGHLADEYRATGLPEHTRAAILRRLLAVLLLRLTHVAAPSGTTSPEHADTFQRFRAAVERDYTRARDVGHYARVLGYAPRTLTRAALDASGVGAKEFIDRRVVLEAKRLLAHGDDPVSQIATRLGFLDTSNFVKYFTQRTTTTPATFRTTFRPSP